MSIVKKYDDGLSDFERSVKDSKKIKPGKAEKLISAERVDSAVNFGKTDFNSPKVKDGVLDSYIGESDEFKKQLNGDIADFDRKFKTEIGNPISDVEDKVGIINDKLTDKDDILSKARTTENLYTQGENGQAVQTSNGDLKKKYKINDLIGHTSDINEGKDYTAKSNEKVRRFKKDYKFKLNSRKVKPGSVKGENYSDKFSKYSSVGHSVSKRVGDISEKVKVIRNTLGVKRNFDKTFETESGPQYARSIDRFIKGHDEGKNYGKKFFKTKNFKGKDKVMIPITYFDRETVNKVFLDSSDYSSSNDLRVLEIRDLLNDIEYLISQITNKNNYKENVLACLDQVFVKITKPDGNYAMVIAAGKVFGNPTYVDMDVKTYGEVIRNVTSNIDKMDSTLQSYITELNSLIALYESPITNLNYNNFAYNMKVEFKYDEDSHKFVTELVDGSEYFTAGYSQSASNVVVGNDDTEFQFVEKFDYTASSVNSVISHFERYLEVASLEPIELLFWDDKNGTKVMNPLVVDVKSGKVRLAISYACANDIDFSELNANNLKYSGDRTVWRKVDNVLDNGVLDNAKPVYVRIFDPGQTPLSLDAFVYQVKSSESIDVLDPEGDGNQPTSFYYEGIVGYYNGMKTVVGKFGLEQRYESYTMYNISVLFRTARRLKRQHQAIEDSLNIIEIKDSYSFDFANDVGDVGYSISEIYADADVAALLVKFGILNKDHFRTLVATSPNNPLRFTGMSAKGAQDRSSNAISLFDGTFKSLSQTQSDEITNILFGNPDIGWGVGTGIVVQRFHDERIITNDNKSNPTGVNLTELANAVYSDSAIHVGPPEIDFLFSSLDTHVINYSLAKTNGDLKGRSSLIVFDPTWDTTLSKNNYIVALQVNVEKVIVADAVFCLNDEQLIALEALSETAKINLFTFTSTDFSSLSPQSLRKLYIALFHIKAIHAYRARLLLRQVISAFFTDTYAGSRDSELHIKRRIDNIKRFLAIFNEYNNPAYARVLVAKNKTNKTSVFDAVVVDNIEDKQLLQYINITDNSTDITNLGNRNKSIIRAVLIRKGNIQKHIIFNFSIVLMNPENRVGESIVLSSPDGKSIQKRYVNSSLGHYNKTLHSFGEPNNNIDANGLTLDTLLANDNVEGNPFKIVVSNSVGDFNLGIRQIRNIFKISKESLVFPMIKQISKGVVLLTSDVKNVQKDVIVNGQRQVKLVTYGGFPSSSVVDSLTTLNVSVDGNDGLLYLALTFYPTSWNALAASRFYQNFGATFKLGRTVSSVKNPKAVNYALTSLFDILRSINFVWNVRNTEKGTVGATIKGTSISL